MLTGTIRKQVDQVWDAFWSGGISNPLTVIEQITYLLFLKRLDEVQTRLENQSTATGKPIEKPIYPEGKDSRGHAYSDLRWKNFKNLAPQEMFQVVSEGVFPFIRDLGQRNGAYTKHMEGATFLIPTPGLLAKVVALVDEIDMDDRDTKGDIYEYMLGKIATAGQNGQFRTPRHIISLMVAITEPNLQDVICDPSCGTCGFLTAAAGYLEDRYHQDLLRQDNVHHFHNEMFYGFDFDQTMLRIGGMNMLLHGLENPKIEYRDSLSEFHTDDRDRCSLILANPPFAGSIDESGIAKDLSQVVKTKKTELLFLALFLRMLKPGGRAAVIVPDGVLFGSSKAHKALRQTIVEDQQLQAVISLPSGAFKPYAGVSTAILVFTKTNSGGTENVWFYDIKADGWSLDDKRQPLLEDDKLGVPLTYESGQPRTIKLSDEEHLKNNLPDVFFRFFEREDTELQRPRTAQSFCVPKAEIAENGYDLSLNRYKEIEHEAIEHRDPKEIIAELWKLEEEIQEGMKELEKML